MASENTSNASCKHSREKCISSNASNISLDESDISIRSNDMNLNEHSYANTPSPSSIASTSTIDNSFQCRSSNLKTDHRSQMFPKRRYRHEKLFHHTNSLNRQYVVAMTNILFQMQKDIYKLKRRTYRVEQMLVKQNQSAHPIIRIPRLTRNEISTICSDDDENQQTNSLEENIMINESEPPTTNESRNEQHTDAEGVEPIDPTPPQKTKYCFGCNHEFSHRSGYLRHIKNIHKGKIPTTSTRNNPPEVTSLPDDTNILSDDQPLICSDPENESLHFLVNQWDIGEGRLRPRPTPKCSNGPADKVKCDVCGKFFRAEYIKKHKRRTHSLEISPESNDVSEQNNAVLDKPMDGIETISNASPIMNTDPPSTITVAEMDFDDIPLDFDRHPMEPIVIATTCLQRYQLDLIDEFLKKFPTSVCQTASVDSRTTHLITNDDALLLHSPLSMKLIEGVANHCYCVSYRWIIECLKYDRIVDECRFEIEGDDSDANPHGGPKRSRLIDKRHSLFENIRFMIKCTENNEIKLSNNRLQDLITTCGGQIITCVTRPLLDDYTIVVLCDKLYVSERRHNYDQCRQLGIHFVSSDWVLESILEYRQKDLSLYKEIPS